jgi:hypothetical protein
MEGDGKKDIEWRELGLAALFCAGGALAAHRFASISPGWGSIGSWSAAVWAAGLSLIALAAAFLILIYRCYFRRRYGRRAPWMMAGFVCMHALVALFLLSRAGGTG